MPESIITSINLPSGNVLQTPVAIVEGHIGLPLGDGNILCVSHLHKRSLILSNAHEVITKLNAPNGYVYGGHGLVLEKKGVFVLPLMREVQNSLSDVGLLHIHDVKTHKLITAVESGGLHPHEIHETPETGEIVVTHYGELTGKHDPFYHHVVEPKLTILDAGTFAPKRHYAQEKHPAMLTHMAVSDDGYAYCVMSQYINIARESLTQDRAVAKKRLLDEMQAVMGRRPEIDIPDISFEPGEKRAAMPLPLLRINTRTGEMEEIYTEDKNHLRSLSVAYNEQTQTVLATYYHSNVVVLRTAGGESEAISGKTLGLDGVIGIANLPGTSMVSIAGVDKGAVIYDLVSREVVARHDVDLRGATHIGVESTAS